MGNFLSKRIDPVQFLHETLVENVFGYLCESDILRCSLVSRDWHKFIGRSSVCMRKVELKFHNLFRITIENVELFASSNRSYCGVSISNTELSSQAKVILSQFRWKSVKLCNLKFESDIDFLNFLGLFEPSVEKIGFKNIKIVTVTKDLQVSLIFPKLRHLEIAMSSRFIFKKMFCECAEVKQLSLDFPCSQFEDEDLREISTAIQHFLIINRKLEILHLGLSTVIFNQVFTEDFITKVAFTLRSVKLHRFKRTQNFRNSQAMVNLEIFLLMNSSTLERIHLEQWMGFHILSIVFNEMKKVKTVIIKELHEYGVKEDAQFLSLNCNPSIKFLNVYTFARYHEVFDVILKSSTNIQTLKMFTLTQQVLNILSANHHQLEYLYLDCITADDPIKDDAFPKLKFICAYLFISRKFREAIESTPSWRQTNFDRKLINFFNEFKLFWSH